MAAICPQSWICCDIIILPQGIHYHDPNILLNFCVDWFCSFVVFIARQYADAQY